MRTAPKRIAFVAADVDGPAPVVLGRVWEGSLPYALGRTVIVLAPNGSRRFTLTAPGSRRRAERALARLRGGAGERQRADDLARGRGAPRVGVRARRRAGRGARGARASSSKTRDGLEIRNGDTIRDVALPRGARFLGLSEGIVAYGYGRQLRLKQITGGHDTLFRTLQPRFHAQLGRRGIAFGSGRTLGFTAWALVGGSV